VAKREGGAFNLSKIKVWRDNEGVVNDQKV
jgi:hypothetical protein